MRVGNRNMRIQVGNNAVLFAVVALEMAYREDSASAAPRRRRVLRPLFECTQSLFLTSCRRLREQRKVKSHARR